MAYYNYSIVCRMSKKVAIRHFFELSQAVVYSLLIREHYAGKLAKAVYNIVRLYVVALKVPGQSLLPFVILRQPARYLEQLFGVVVILPELIGPNCRNARRLGHINVLCKAVANVYDLAGEVALPLAYAA